MNLVASTIIARSPPKADDVAISSFERRGCHAPIESGLAMTFLDNTFLLQTGDFVRAETQKLLVNIFVMLAELRCVASDAARC